MKRALVYAHFDRDGIFDPHVVAALRAYRPWFERVTVVSTAADRLPPALAGLVDAFVPRENVGYDFASWKAGLPGDLGAWDEIVCANDSVYGPLCDPAPLFADARVAAAELWGMCLSLQGTKRRGPVECPHLQSWWFAMRRPLLESAACAAFWDGVVPLPSKEDVIDRHEIGMTEHFVRHGFRIAALYDARVAGPLTWREILPHLSPWQPARSRRHLRKARRSPHNPSELVWRRLLDAGVPFVKVGLFRVNHYGLDLDRVLRGIAASTPYDVGLIRHHLRRIGPA